MMDADIIIDKIYTFIIVFVIINLVFLLVYNLAYGVTNGNEKIIIKEKWVKYHWGTAKYLVSSENNQVFEITDSYIKWRFNSSEVYSQIEPGHTCYIKTQGWRFPFCSDYKNIIKADCNTPLLEDKK